MNWGTALISVILAATVVSIIFRLIKNKKNGKSRCPGCSGCSACCGKNLEADSKTRK